MTVAEAITALTAIGALIFTGLSLNASRDQVAAVQQQNSVAEQARLNLSGAYVVAANLRGADLSGADLRGTNLQDAVHDERTIVDGAITDSTTVGLWW